MFARLLNSLCFKQSIKLCTLIVIKIRLRSDFLNYELNATQRNARNTFKAFLSQQAPHCVHCVTFVCVALRMCN